MLFENTNFLARQYPELEVCLLGVEERHSAFSTSPCLRDFYVPSSLGTATLVPQCFLSLTAAGGLLLLVQLSSVFTLYSRTAGQWVG
jgi:hypothetical protein